MQTINAIIDGINSTADGAEYKCYEALYAVLGHVLDMLVEWVNMRFPVGDAPYPVPQGWDKIEAPEPVHLRLVEDMQTGEVRCACWYESQPCHGSH